MGKVILAFLLGTIPVAAVAQHRHGDHAGAAMPRERAQEWTRYPLLLAAMVRGGDRSSAALRTAGIEAHEVQVFAADGPAERRRVSYPVKASLATIEAAATKVGNYHWVIAREETESEVRVASTAWYFSNPGSAPRALLKQTRHELEIVPQPLPREHGSYRESEKWRFLVRWQGQPLAGQSVTLETESGSRSRYVTDAGGMATVLFPRDVRPAAEAGRGHGGPQRAKFVLAAEREGNGKRYLTAFNYTYSPDPDRDRSLTWGVAFALAGMVGALPLLRRRSASTNSGGNHA
jgi:hypothetical protein